jgi:hypothetical protein
VGPPAGSTETLRGCQTPLSEAQIKRLEKLTAEYVANIAKILLNAN